MSGPSSRPTSGGTALPDTHRADSPAGGDVVGGGDEALSKTDRVRGIAERSLEELCTQIEAGNSTQLDAYLDAMGRFHAYSFNNVMLILSQRPDATRVAGFRTWKSLGRSVKKGEKGIAIFAPMRVKAKEESETSDDEDGSRVIFRVVHVFDVAQTEGEPLPEPVRVGGDPGAYLDRLCEAVVASGISLETSFELGSADGVSRGGAIALRPGLSGAEYFSVLAHEWAHELLHQGDGAERPDKAVREIEAEAVAFVVGRSIGLETSSAASDYIRMYAGEKGTLLASLERVRSTACRIIESINEPTQQVSREPSTAERVAASNGMRR